MYKRLLGFINRVNIRQSSCVSINSERPNHNLTDCLIYLWLYSVSNPNMSCLPFPDENLTDVYAILE